MSDGVIITIDMVIKPELAEAVCAGIPGMFTLTVTFKGFRSIRVVRHKDAANHLLIVEHWDAEEDYRAYEAWRNRDGEMDRAREHLLSLKAEVWPGLIGFAAR
ncbi:putative quinol monooxygenase [Acidocella sp.]|uniref:putative quinol monooxygenase n=1 Tax=Acidocella sp. TaxID=50710 RepID=UPI00261D9978|nr:antibiotic biosynthesis monooxygenase [Acidocella sp.]